MRAGHKVHEFVDVVGDGSEEDRLNEEQLNESITRQTARGTCN